jgi:hypothetical protein
VRAQDDRSLLNRESAAKKYALLSEDGLRKESNSTQSKNLVLAEAQSSQRKLRKDSGIKKSLLTVHARIQDLKRIPFSASCYSF